MILTNSPENIIHTDMITTNLSDHEMVGAIRKKCKHKYQPKEIRSRYKNYDKENIIKDVKNINWDSLFMSKDPTYAWNILKETVLKIASNHAPFTIKTIKRKPCPWLNESIKREMNFRDTLNRRAQKNKTEENWNAYKREKNKVNNIIKNAKISRYKDILEEHATKPEKVWKCIKNLFPTKAEKDMICTKFEVDGKLICDKLQIANGFC